MSELQSSVVHVNFGQNNATPSSLELTPEQQDYINDYSDESDKYKAFDNPPETDSEYADALEDECRRFAKLHPYIIDMLNNHDHIGEVLQQVADTGATLDQARAMMAERLNQLVSDSYEEAANDTATVTKLGTRATHSAKVVTLADYRD